MVGGTIILIYISILYTQSRGGYMGFFTGLVIFALAAGRKIIFREWKKLAALGAIIIIISAVTMLRPEYSPFQRFTDEISAKSGETAGGENEGGLELKGAAGSRGETWKSAFKIIADYPFFGIGPEVLKMIFPRYETELFRYKEAFHVKQDRCHNETFDVPVTKGLIAFVAYLWLLSTVFKTGLKKLKSANETQQVMLAALMAAMAAYLVQNQFSFGVVAITSIFWVMWAMVMVLGKDAKAEVVAPSKIKSLPWITLAALTIITMYLIYLSFFSFRADVFFKEGKSRLESRPLQPAVDQLNASLKILPFEGITVSHLAIAYLNLNKPQDAIDTLKYGTLVDPYNADNFHMFSKLLISLYDRGMREALAEAKKDAEIAIAIDPYYAEAYESLGMISEREGKPAAALELYEKSFHANPTLAGVIQKTEGLSRQLGKVEQARAIFEEAYDRFPDNIELFKALEKTRR
jgi:tetratricopeptide (TPR) repeat protein